jgi:hypothetical protein
MSTLNVTNLTGPSNTGTAATLSSINGGPISGARNRIINGDMRIDQRNGGAATANTINGYTVDRWAVNQSVVGKVLAQQSTPVVPPGFTHSLSVTSQSSYNIGAGDYYLVTQAIEGFNLSDLGWGTVSARAITLSFWVYSSLTGTFGGAVRNHAENRSYPFSYSISASNTWEFKTLTIAGPTSGTWEVGNSRGLQLHFSLGSGSTWSGSAGSWQNANLLSVTGAVSLVGTNGATFFITGVQLEAGAVATPFERRSYGQELALCQRYTLPVQVTLNANNQGGAGAPFAQTIGLLCQMRVAPTFSSNTAAANTNAAATTVDTITSYSARIYSTSSASGNLQINYTGIATAEL